MKLRFKLNIILMAVLIIVSSIILFFSAGRIEKSFISVENKYFNGFYSELTHEIELYLGYKDKILKDWSRWDALYGYVEGKNDSDINEILNLAPSSFEDLDLKFILIENEGNILYGKHYDCATQNLSDLSDSFIDQVMVSKEDSGLFYFDDKVYAVFGSSIGNNDGSEISDSHLIIGYYFGIDEIRDSFIKDHFSVEIDYDSKSMDSYLGAYAKRELEITKMYYRIPYLNTKDLGFEVTMIFENDIMLLSEKMIGFIVILIVAMVITLFILLNILINKMILSRIDIFNNIVTEITKNNDLTKRIVVSGKDEISQLKRQFNNMIGKLEDTNKTLENDAMVDFHTGAYVKKYGYNLLSQYISRSIEEDSKLYGIYIDIDDLKYVNDTFGHMEGDRLLNIVTGFLFDNLLDDSGIIRVGGDEFFIFSYDKEEKTILEFIDKVIIDIEKYNKDSVFMRNISFSWGHSKYDNSMTMEDFIELADKRMYSNKQNK